jgi:hypothetical protein
MNVPGTNMKLAAAITLAINLAVVGLTKAASSAWHRVVAAA